MYETMLNLFDTNVNDFLGTKKSGLSPPVRNPKHATLGSIKGLAISRV
jgi:hypothetical protein